VPSVPPTSPFEPPPPSPPGYGAPEGAPPPPPGEPPAPPADPYATPAPPADPYATPAQPGQPAYGSPDQPAYGQQYGQQQPYAQQPYGQQQPYAPAYGQVAPYGVSAEAPYGVDHMGRPFSDKSKIVAGVLQLFLGGFGAGRWYTGHYGIAVAQLLTCGGCGVWSLVDGILMLVGNVTDPQGRPLRG
jgi:hypothetical protein